MTLFSGVEEMVNKRVQPVINSIEKKLAPRLDELTKAVNENTLATIRLTNAVEKIAKILGETEKK